MLIEKARTIMKKSRVPTYLWSEGVNTLNYLVNRGPICTNNGKTLSGLEWYVRGFPQNTNQSCANQRYKKKPRVDHLKVFGCLAYLLMLMYLNKIEISY